MSEFVNYLHEVFEHFGPIRSRKMFGGHGIYHNDLMFALVADDVLFLKGDDDTIPKYEENGMEPFQFEMKGKVGTMKYYSAPEDIYDDPELASQWAELAYGAAQRADTAKRKKKKRSVKRGKKTGE